MRGLRAKSIFMHKILNDDPAPNLRNSFARRNTCETNYQLRNSENDLSPSRPKGEFLKGSFKYNGAMIWNQLLNEAKLSDSLNSFKNKLIT